MTQEAKDQQDNKASATLSDSGKCGYGAAVTAMTLAVLQALLILVSWLIAAAYPDSMVRSLLSSEGIRWFFAHFADNILTPVLLWLLLGSMAAGALTESGLWATSLHLLHVRKANQPLLFRQKFAFRVVCIEVAIVAVVVLLLTAIPHAVLLSVTGKLFPSSFSASIVPIVSFTLCLSSVTYAYMCGQQRSLVSITNMLTAGIGRLGVIWLIYILAAQLFFSICYVFSISA